MRRAWLGVLLAVCLPVTGCGALRQTAGTYVVRVLDARQQAAAIVLYTQDVNKSTTGEDIVDLRTPDGVTNYVHARFPNAQYDQIHIIRPNDTGSNHVIAANHNGRGTPAVPPAAATPVPATGVVPTTSTIVPPPGCRLDPSITPAAPPTASRSVKANAVMSVATSKLGAPYIWGHNEDRGQYGFDCSNFTAYVYRHALGYVLSGASQTQNRSIGVPVPRSQMQVGDLLIFENGAHVGIYAGQNQVIQEGGGLRKVGYLNISPGNYWSNHLTSVRRMF